LRVTIFIKEFYDDDDVSAAIYSLYAEAAQNATQTHISEHQINKSNRKCKKYSIDQYYKTITQIEMIKLSFHKDISLGEKKFGRFSHAQ